MLGEMPTTGGLFMSGQVRRLRTAFGLAALLLPGCLSCFNPTPDLPPEIQQQCQSVSPYCRNNVYVVLVNGVDPLCCANLKGVRDYLNSLGFVKCYYAQLYHEGCLLEELRELREVHPDARIAIVGFECGAGPARSLARKAAEEGLSVDLLMLLQPKTLLADLGAPLPAIPRVIAVRAGKPEATESGWNAAESIEVPCSSRYGVPTHPLTLQTLTDELNQLAMNVPVRVEKVLPFPSLMDSPEPTPRPVAPTQESSMDDWDFLKPSNGERGEPRLPSNFLLRNDSK
jgi:hypothetical protein